MSATLHSRGPVSDYKLRVNEYWTCCTIEQMDALAAFCVAKQILDIGAGFGTLADFLIYYGAKHVLCLDKENYRMKLEHLAITWVHETFAEFAATSIGQHFNIGILSWPTNSAMAMCPVVEILKRCDYVVYIGSNQSGSQCGVPYLWDYLITRCREIDLPAANNSLMIYGPGSRACWQKMTEEERCGLNADFERPVYEKSQ